ncbi:MAG: hypothetical protein HRU31_03065 [Rhodobacteraceae bacterium]|nr:hypothetical protein [Paracoccaceae bacterium]
MLAPPTSYASDPTSIRLRLSTSDAGFDADQVAFWDSLHPSEAIHQAWAAFQAHAILCGTTQTGSALGVLSLGSVSSDAIFALGGDDLVLAFNGNDIVLSGLSALGIKARAVETRVLDDGNGASLTRDSLKDMLAAELDQTGQTANFWGVI